MHLLLQACSLAAFLSCVGAVTQQVELAISDAIISPDGFSKSAIVVNGQTPGPLITANTGDSMQINVENQLSDPSMNLSTTVHWHGLYQQHTNSFDGTAFVTQCPIIPGNSFLYQFDIQNQSGTFWYHSHYGLQYCDGLRGPFIVYDPNDPYQSMYDVDDNSTIITMEDWYHINVYDVPDAENPNSILVNGVGRYPGGPNVPLSITNVEYGKRYRIRLLNMACKTNVLFSIDNHNFTIIEADGKAVLPLSVDQIAIFPGQRYSFVLEATQPVDNYWIRMLPGNYASNFTDGLNSAILRYAGAPDSDPTNKTWSLVNPLDETALHARDNPTVPGEPYPGGADVSIDLVAIQNMSTSEFYMNGVNYVPPPVPTLLQILSGAQGIAALAEEGSVYTLPPNQVIEVSFPAEFLPMPHPFHLHGHSFYVVRSAGTTEYNFVNPVQRDTVNIGQDSDNVTIRFVTDNSGPWLIHCHIDWHLLWGMAVVFAENPNGTAQNDPVNSEWENLCPLYNNNPSQH